MEEKLSHLDQYKMLREELMHHLVEIYRTEIASIATLGAVYGWLLTLSHRVYPIMQFVPVIVIVIAGIRCLMLLHRVHSIAEYLTIIEKNAFGVEETELPGWERHLKRNGKSRIISTSVVVWIFMLVIGLILSIYLSTHYPSELQVLSPKSS